jgi:uncharacterized SAM-binding protein YcdF (DUF218 family)
MFQRPTERDIRRASSFITRMTAKARKCLRLLFVAGVLGCAVAVLGGLFFSAGLLRLEDPLTTGDVMVVLGGEIVYRPARALELYQQGSATNVIITGEGDCESVRTMLAGKGVGASAIQMECASRTTRENAMFTVPLLRAQHAKRVILVTSWYHSRRSLYCFRHFAPEIEFISLPTTADLPRNHWPKKWERRWVLSEYLKIVYYRVRFGIASWG